MSLLNKLKALLCREKSQPIQERFLKYYQPELIKGKQEILQQATQPALAAVRAPRQRPHQSWGENFNRTEWENYSRSE